MYARGGGLIYAYDEVCASCGDGGIVNSAVSEICTGDESVGEAVSWMSECGVGVG